MGGRHEQRRGPEESGLGRTETVGGVVWPSRERGKPSGRPRTSAYPKPHGRLPEASRPPLPLPAWCRFLTKRRQRRGPRAGAAEATRDPGFPSPTLPPVAAVSAGGMAAAAMRHSGRTSVPRLLLLLLVPLLWASAGVRAVPEEDLSHRNKEPPAPVQQLQPQPAAAQVPEPVRAEVSRTGWGGRGCGAGCAGYQAHCRPERRPRPWVAGGGEGSPAGLLEMEDCGGRFFRGHAGPRPAPHGGGDGEPKQGARCNPLVREDLDGSLADQIYPIELEILIPSRKSNRAAGRLFFSDDYNIGLFIVETAYPKLFTQIQLCTTCDFYARYIWIMKHDSHFLKTCSGL